MIKKKYSRANGATVEHEAGSHSKWEVISAEEPVALDVNRIAFAFESMASSFNSIEHHIGKLVNHR